MSFLKRLFGSAVEPAQDFDTTIATCQFKSSNNDCSLVRELKEKQTAKRAVDNKIKSYDEHSVNSIASFFDLLVKMEKDGFEMGTSSYYPGSFNSSERSRIADSFERSFCMIKLENILSSMFDEDIAAISSELFALRTRSAVLGDLRRQSAKLDKEIAAIKAQLGIE